MEIGKRLQSYILTPLTIDPLFGVKSLYAYFADMEDGGDIVMSKYREAKEARKPEYYTADNSPKLIDYAVGQANGKDKKVAVLKLNGTMSVDGGLCTQGIDALCKEVEMAAGAADVAGIVIDTYCGGGEALAAQRLGIAIEKAKAVKPVVQYGDYIASGAYWAGAKCNEIVVGGNISEVGSIGVVIQLDKQQIEYLKENLINVYSDGSEDKHFDLKSILSGDFDALKKKSLNPLKEEFHSIVKAGRKDVKDEAMTGHMYLAKDAKKLGLIDHIADREFAVRRVISLSRKYTSINNVKKIMNHV